MEIEYEATFLDINKEGGFNLLTQQFIENFIRGLPV